MLYGYKCDKCEKEFDVTKHHSKYKDPEYCPSCNEEARRLFGRTELSVDKMQPEYYHAFNEVVRNRQHRKELIKKHGMVEIGSEKPKNMHAHFEKTREERHKRSWGEV